MNPRRALMPPSPLHALCMLPSAFPVSRVDQALVERGLCESREKAKRAIMAGQVTINRQPARKPSDHVGPDDQIELVAGEKYVGRGGDRKSTRLNSSHGYISYAVFCLKKKKNERPRVPGPEHHQAQSLEQKHTTC